MYVNFDHDDESKSILMTPALQYQLLTDTKGSIVYSLRIAKGNASVILLPQGLSAGMYTIQMLHDRGSVFIYKFIKK
jgi:hypothetical protein